MRGLYRAEGCFLHLKSMSNESDPTKLDFQYHDEPKNSQGKDLTEGEKKLKEEAVSRVQTITN